MQPATAQTASTPECAPPARSEVERRPLDAGRLVRCPARCAARAGRRSRGGRWQKARTPRAPHVRCRLTAENLLHQSRLADAGLALDLDARAEAHRSRPTGRPGARRRSSARPTKVTSVVDDRPRPTTDVRRRSANCGRVALTRNGSSRVVSNGVASVRWSPGWRSQLAGARLRHQPGGKVHGVAHHRVTRRHGAPTSRRTRDGC